MVYSLVYVISYCEGIPYNKGEVLFVVSFLLNVISTRINKYVSNVPHLRNNILDMRGVNIATTYVNSNLIQGGGGKNNAINSDNYPGLAAGQQTHSAQTNIYA
jgi:hypothetical protein